MDNLARIVMVTVRTGEIQPCVRVLRGAWIAATEQGATFKVEVIINYTSGGTPARASGAFFVKDMTFRQLLEPMWVRGLGKTLRMPSEPDPDQQFTCQAKLSIMTAAGEHVDCSPFDSVVLTPVQGTGGGGAGGPT